MKQLRQAIVAGGLTAGTVAASGLSPLAEHVDVVPSYGDGGWSWHLETNTGVVDPETVYLPLRDLDFQDGERYVRPSGTTWEFLGVDAGEPVWIISSSDFGYTWPGFQNAQTGVFGSYVETDPRVSGVAQPWIRVSLVEVEGPGEFSMYDFEAGSVVVWMSTVDEIDSTDVFFFASPGHSHVYWSFGARGVYRVRMKADGYLGDGATDAAPTSDPVDVYFTVGGFAEWRAGHFPAETVMDESLAGAGADPDEDGRVNLLEYAFGTDPAGGSPMHEEFGEASAPEVMIVEDGGEHYPALRFFRRIHEDAGVSYGVEWSDGLAGEWSEGGVEADTEALDENWERVTVRSDATVSSGAACFGRVRVETPAN
ncbi:MAG: choice-of-anchor M domain-containing protein [Verrucomicrobiota bacterium JB025]|nr:choice-of-anchor M domain-containing protein [Verrucomicrobiota bacterium JB025]